MSRKMYDIRHTMYEMKDECKMLSLCQHPAKCTMSGVRCTIRKVERLMERIAIDCGPSTMD